VLQCAAAQPGVSRTGVFLMMDPRQALVDAANSVLGWTAPSDDYLNLIDPGDPTARQRVVAEESDCGLVVLGIQEIVFDVPARGPYRDTTAFNLVYTRACGNPWAPGGAFRLASLDAPPQLGDVVVYGPAPSGSPPAHMEHVIEAVVNISTMTLKCVAGGEKSGALETVAVMQRELTWKGVWTDDANGRAIIGIVDAEVLASMFTMRDAV
jgi:hypothetical protein